jgi:ATP-dependent exoDNAse (exonuclease V) beta subunit
MSKYIKMSFKNKSIMCPILINKNSHSRDKNIKFFEEDHKYIITCDPDSKYTSVTTWCHSHFPHFDADEVINNMMKGKNWKEGHKYWGLTADEIKAKWSENGNSVAGAGTDLHYEIECFNNDKRFQFSYSNKELYEIYMIDFKDKIDVMPIEWGYFLNFVRDNPTLIPYRTEWTIYDEDIKIAGSIDMVYENPDGTLSIYDWKRAKNITRINNFNKFAISQAICHLPDSNFWHYALQLNTYKVILEQKYEKKVKDLYLVRLHPDAEEKNYELIKLPDLTKDIIDLLKERKRTL